MWNVKALVGTFHQEKALVGAFHLLRSNSKNFGAGSFAALVTIARSDKLINFAHSDLSSIDVLRHTSGIFVNLKIDFVQRTGADGNIYLGSYHEYKEGNNLSEKTNKFSAPYKC